MCCTACVLNSMSSYCRQPAEQRVRDDDPARDARRRCGRSDQRSPRRWHRQTPTGRARRPAETHQGGTQRERPVPEQPVDGGRRRAVVARRTSRRPPVEERARSRPQRRRRTETRDSAGRALRRSLRVGACQNAFRGCPCTRGRPSSRLTDPPVDGVGRNHHLVVVRADVLRGAVRDVLHGPFGQAPFDWPPVHGDPIGQPRSICTSSTR